MLPYHNENFIWVLEIDRCLNIITLDLPANICDKLFLERQAGTR